MASDDVEAIRAIANELQAAIHEHIDLLRGEVRLLQTPSQQPPPTRTGAGRNKRRP